MKWIEFSRARSVVAEWVLKHDPKKVVRFRLKEICDYDGREKDNTVAKGYLDPIREEDLLHIIMAHKVIADLIERELLEPEIGKNNIETYKTKVLGKEKEWRKLVGAGGNFRHRVTMSRRWFGERLWLFVVWLVTIVATQIIRSMMS